MQHCGQFVGSAGSGTRGCPAFPLPSHFAPLFRQLGREKPRHSTTMPAFFAADLTKNRRKLLGPGNAGQPLVQHSLARLGRGR
jgi:hypothetical protein